MGVCDVPRGAEKMRRPPGKVPLGAPDPAGTGEAIVDGISWNALNPRVQYGGDELEQACELVEHLRGGAPALRAVRLDAVRALWSVMSSLPRHSVTLTRSSNGREIERHLGIRRWGVRKNRIAQGVLPVPASEQEYLRRGHRLVRRQVGRARAAGVTCEVLGSDGERVSVRRWLSPRIAGLDGWLDDLPHPSDACWWVARSADGDPLALAIVAEDSDWALLEILLSTDHAARYLLHTEVLSSLARAGVRYQLTISPPVPRMDPNLRYFQRMLGYRVAHLVVR
jgi:hypothetical protein